MMEPECLAASNAPPEGRTVPRGGISVASANVEWYDGPCQCDNGRLSYQLAYPCAPLRVRRTMRITMIGAGNVGGTLGRRWAAAGHDVTFGSRRGGDVQASEALPSNVRVAPLSESVRGADVVVLATPWDAA